VPDEVGETLSGDVVYQRCQDSPVHCHSHFFVASLSVTPEIKQTDINKNACFTETQLVFFRMQQQSTNIVRIQILMRIE